MCIPISLLGNASVKILSSLLGNGPVKHYCCNEYTGKNRRIVGHIDSYANKKFWEELIAYFP
jgi:hypothetical protein